MVMVQAIPGAGHGVHGGWGWGREGGEHAWWRCRVGFLDGLKLVVLLGGMFRVARDAGVGVGGGVGVAGHLGGPMVWVVAADGGRTCSTIVTVTWKMASLSGPLSSSGGFVTSVESFCHITRRPLRQALLGQRGPALWEPWCVWPPGAVIGAREASALHLPG